ncbi:hypothetical protein DBR06_SOUSAS9510029, partial [Sousa chinensis]
SVGGSRHTLLDSDPLLAGPCSADSDENSEGLGAKLLPRRICMVEPEMLRPEEARRDRGSQQDPESLALPNAGSAALKATTVTLPK